MPSAAHPPPPTPTERAEYRGEALAVRSVIGGALMGLANLVPGISGGTMLLAVDTTGYRGLSRSVRSLDVEETGG